MAGKRQARADSANGDASVELIEQATMELLREQGVLAGLNMREVADRAGVNRGLVYYHFGSRRELLRATISRLLAPLLKQFRFASEPAPIGQRARDDFELVLSAQEAIRLLMLLVLDGESQAMMPNLRDQLTALAADQEAGLLDEAIDPKLVLVAMRSLAFGYAVNREHFAREMWIEPEELDRGLSDLIVRLFGALSPPDEARHETTRRARRRPNDDQKGAT